MGGDVPDGAEKGFGVGRLERDRAGVRDRGAAVGVAGVGAILWVVVEAARSGCSERNALGECTRERELRRGPAVAVGVLGAALMATGVVLILRSRGEAESGPEVSARVQEELARVLNGGRVTLDHLPQLTYLECVIKESLRVLPSVWAYAREATEDVTLAGYTLKKGTTVTISHLAMGHNETYYPDATRFLPERWTREFEKSLRQAYDHALAVVRDDARARPRPGRGGEQRAVENRCALWEKVSRPLNEPSTPIPTQAS